jgi:iron complex outermembrane receptor protein
MKKKSIIILLMLSSAYLLNAQQLKDTISFRYPSEVQVSAPRMNAPLSEIPFATSIVGQDILSQIPRTVSIDEALKLVPGIKIDNQSNAERVHISIRGQGILTERGIRGINILLDGLPLNDPSGLAPDLFDVDFNFVDKIEVLRGPAASLYGGSASGGIINITTQKAPNIPIFGEVYGSGGSNTFWKGAGKFGGQVNDVNYIVSFSRTMGDGYRQHEHFWGNNLYGKATYTPNEYIELTPIFIYIDSYHENPEGIPLTYYNLDPKLPNDAAIPANEYLETQRITNGLKGKIKIANNQDVTFNALVRKTTFTEASNGAFNNRWLTTSGASLQYNLGYGAPDAFFRNNVSVGTDLNWQSIAITNLQHQGQDSLGNFYVLPGYVLNAKENIKQNSIGLFLIDKIDLAKNWSIMLSLRYDKMHNELTDLLNTDSTNGSGNKDFNKTTGRIGVTYSPLPEVSLFVNWGQGFLPPTTEELSQNPLAYGGFNKNLTFATSNGIDLGVRGALDKQNLYYDVTGFYLTTQNDFDRFRIPGPRHRETFYRNSPSTERYGLELYAAYFPLNKLELQVAYTYSHFKYTSDSLQILMDDNFPLRYILKGNFLPNSPMHQLYVDLQYTLMHGLLVGLSAETLSKTYIDGANIESEAAVGYTLLHARINYQLPVKGLDAELMFSGRNLTDQKYAAFTEPDASGNSYQPGAGREFFGSLRIRF